MSDAPRHIPVMLAEVLEALQVRAGETYIDGTFGAGGYSRAILESADCRVIAFDRDNTAVQAAAAICQQFRSRLALINKPFSQMEEFARLELMCEGMPEISGPRAGGIVLDIGVSSMQLDQAERGFSFQHDGPLDMRMSAEGMTAADFINTGLEETIANVIYEFGDERRSRAIAKAIVKERNLRPFTRTSELADLVLRVFHGRKEDGRHPATRTFQALRIHVNDELGELDAALRASERLLKPGGRLVVVSFHSLEDRIVKKFLTERAGREPNASRYAPPQSIQSLCPSFRIVNTRPLTPSKGELDVNPRSRSARLRAAVRTEAPSWPADS
ncbi:MAG: 16S rRNA (cytosine(1402)-N(4))-methyltransferase RsmH [Hyphomicrobium sp.]